MHVNGTKGPPINTSPLQKNTCNTESCMVSLMVLSHIVPHNDMVADTKALDIGAHSFNATGTL
jgi:hypothetical protein